MLLRLIGAVLFCLSAVAQPLPLGTGITPPRPLRNLDISITEEAHRAGAFGTVQMKVVIGTGGVPQEVAITHPVGFGLDEQAVKAVRSWQLIPAQKDGRPLAVEMKVEATYLQGERSSGFLSPTQLVFPELQSAARPVLLQSERPLFLWSPDVDTRGVIPIRFVVDETGAVTNLHILRPLRDDLDAEAVKTVRHWKFAPAQKNGLPVPVRAVLVLATPSLSSDIRLQLEREIGGLWSADRVSLP